MALRLLKRTFSKLTALFICTLFGLYVSSVLIGTIEQDLRDKDITRKMKQLEPDILKNKVDLQKAKTTERVGEEMRAIQKTENEHNHQVR